jgi:hypothetical protein
VGGVGMRMGMNEMRSARREMSKMNTSCCYFFSLTPHAHTSLHNPPHVSMSLSRLIGPVSKRQATNSGAVSVALTPTSVGVTNQGPAPAASVSALRYRERSTSYRFAAGSSYPQGRRFLCSTSDAHSA